MAGTCDNLTEVIALPGNVLPVEVGRTTAWHLPETAARGHANTTSLAMPDWFIGSARTIGRDSRRLITERCGQCTTQVPG